MGSRENRNALRLPPTYKISAPTSHRAGDQEFRNRRRYWRTDRIDILKTLFQCVGPMCRHNIIIIFIDFRTFWRRHAQLGNKT